MMKLKMHPAAHVLQLEHRASPGRTRDRYLHRVRTKFRMPGQQGVAASEENRRVAVMHGLDMENGRRRKIMQEDSAFDVGLNNGTVDFVGEIRVRSKHWQCQN